MIVYGVPSSAMVWPRMLRVAAKTVMPESITDHNDQLARGLAFVGQEEAAELRLNAQQLKKSRRNPRRRHLQRLAASGEIEIVIGGGSHARKRMAAVMHQIKAVQAAAMRLPVLALQVQRDELLRVLIGQRFQEHRTGDGKDGRIAADAQRQREDGGNGKPGVLAQHARTVAEVLKE